ncbi:protein phosphatase 2C domain-containing protein [Massilia sp. YIM B02763]|uniref:protein phosphatase 2C domain-containing protein n=1 Tax=Massilia sp. YIM B02763 TaxID=3050130 RepID=UPI0025B71F6C|nr:protein phosphatase 2C domain-containing protein [Massilia sp. YIM B02763]
MRYSLVTSAGKGHINEDLVAVHERHGVVDIIVMDGATPLSPQRHVRAGASDPSWFVQQFAADLAAVLHRAGSQESLVAQALVGTRAAYRAVAAATNVPPHDWPVATLSWVRVRQGRVQAEGMAPARLELYCLGDSKLLLQDGDGVRDLDPFDNPAEREVQAAVAALVAEGVTDAAARWERLLPMLQARRHAQNTAAHPQVLCLEPRGPFAARTRTLDAPAQGQLLAMTDGFYRLVDTYGLYDDAALAAAALERGLDALVDELRAFEAGAVAAAGITAKRADDASAVAWRFGSSRKEAA